MVKLLMVVAGLLCVCAAAEPTLSFSKDDIPTLRGRVKVAPHDRVWESILQRAKDYCDPNSSSYAGPETIDADPGTVMKIQVLAHTFGRRLTDWVEAIGFAYQITGDEALGKHGALIIETACRRIPVSDPRVAKSFAGARGDIMHGLAVGYDWLGDAMSPEQKALWAQTSQDYVENILAEARQDQTWWVPHHNFMGVAVGAAGCLSLTLKQARPEQAQAWVDECAQIVSRWLDEGFDEQGAYYEGAGYGVYGLTNATMFADALLNNGGPNLFDHPKLKRVPHFYAMSLLPGERVFDARNDSNYAGLGNPLILRIAGAQESGLARWIWERAGGGSAPFSIIWDNDVAPAAPDECGEPPAEHFEGRGLCVFRSGWAKDDMMFAIEAGPYYKVTHNQADKGSITLYGLGHRWAIDSGYGNNREPGGRDQTVAHNCVLIDGEGQAISGAGAGTNGKIITYADNTQYGYALADATDAYNRNNHGQPGATVEHALRHAVFVRPADDLPAYAVVLDDIVKDQDTHEFTWLLHTDTEMQIETGEGTATLRPEGASGGAFVETPDKATGKGSVTWQFEVPEEGDYVVWARVRAAGENAGQSDSFMVSMDGGNEISWHMPSRRDWTWGRVLSGVPQDEVIFPLKPGKHQLRFSTREPGAQVDEVIVSADAVKKLSLDEVNSAIRFEAETGQVSEPMVTVGVGGGTDARMVLAINAEAPVSMSQDMYDSHPRLKVSAEAVNPRFAAVLLPLQPGLEAPVVNFGREGAVTVTVRWPSRVDTIVWSGAGLEPPAISFSAR